MRLYFYCDVVARWIFSLFVYAIVYFKLFENYEQLILNRQEN